MWNLHSFFSTKDALAIHCDTEEKARLLCQAFHSYGKTWVGKESYIDKLEYPYGTETCYTNIGTFGKINLSAQNWTMIPFEEIYLKVISSETINHYKAIIDKEDRILTFSKHPKLYLVYPRILLGITRDALNCEDTLVISVYQDSSTRKFHSFPYNIDTFTAVLYDIQSRGYLLRELS